MPSLKVKPLEWYHTCDLEALIDQGYTPLPESFPKVGRDGYYCLGDKVWFEYDGLAYEAFPKRPSVSARELFCYDLVVNDEAILPQREVDAMKELLGISRDPGVKKAVRKRLSLHERALGRRQTIRDARLARIRILGF